MVHSGAKGFWWQFVMRLLIGLGLGFGAAVPTTLSLTANYPPQRLNSMLIMTVSSGVAVGVIGADLAAAFIISHLRVALPDGDQLRASLLWTPLLFLLLPEFARFLRVKLAGSKVALDVVQRLLGPEAFPRRGRLIAASDVTATEPMLEIVPQGRAFLTIILWFALSPTYTLVFIRVGIPRC
jgi:MFS family permease